MPKRKLPRGGNTQVALSPELAIAAIGIFSAFADGESYNDLETSALADLLSNCDLYEDYAEEDFAALGDEITNLINDEGIEAVVSQSILTAREEGLEEAALVVALVVIAADGEVPEEEQDYIDYLCQDLGIDVERANEIIDELFSDQAEEEDEEE